MGNGGPISATLTPGTAILPPSWEWAIPLLVGIIALVGVTLTAFVSLKNIKRQISSAHALKVAEMRQAWINNLRDAMASFQSYGVTPGLDHSREREWYEKGTKIELFMNPEDPDYANLHSCLYKFLEADNDNEKYAANPQFIEVCQRVLKREWETLKKDVKKAAGEKTST